MSAPSPSAYEQLSPKHRRFLDEYFAGGMVAWRAYVAAGYGGEEPDRRKEGAAWERWNRAVRANSSRLIAADSMQAALRERLAEAAMSAEEVLFRLTEIARASAEDVADVEVFELDGRERRILKLDPAKAIAGGKGHLIRAIKRREDGSIEVTLHDAHKALQDLARVHGLTGPKGTVDDPVHVKMLRWSDADASADTEGDG